MGFFKNLFKRKPGGTALGNLIRGGASAVSGGMLGSGAGLHRWEESQGILAQNEALASMSKAQEQAGQNLINKVAVPYMGDSPSNQPKIGESVFLHSVKKEWWKILIGLAVFGGIIYYISKPKSKSNRFKFR